MKYASGFRGGVMVSVVQMVMLAGRRLRPSVSVQAFQMWPSSFNSITKLRHNTRKRTHSILSNMAKEDQPEVKTVPRKFVAKPFDVRTISLSFHLGYGNSHFYLLAYPAVS